ncbi:MAG: hypothetical protein J6Y37_18515 [Paludibacteraceae bacterium]|nr:hypothetical protein [Paludibacteraceae bacterium]
MTYDYLNKSFNELANIKLNLERDMRLAFMDAAMSSVADNPNPIRRINEKCFVMNFSEVIGKPLCPAFFDWGKSVQTIMQFLDRKPVEEWKRLLEEKMSMAGDVVYFSFKTQNKGYSYTENYPVDKRLITAIVNKL